MSRSLCFVAFSTTLCKNSLEQLRVKLLFCFPEQKIVVSTRTVCNPVPLGLLLQKGQENSGRGFGEGGARVLPIYMLDLTSSDAR